MKGWLTFSIVFSKVIPRVQELDPIVRVEANEAVNKMGTEIGVNVFYIELPVTWTIYRPAAIVTNDTLLGFHYCKCQGL